MRYTQIPADTFRKLQLNAGIILTDFTPGTGSYDEEDFVGATTGGVTFSVTPTFSDFGEDIDNCPKNTKELKRIESYEAKMSGTFVTADGTAIKKLVGAATKTGGDPTYALTSDTALVTGKTYYTRSGSGTSQSPYVYTPVAEPSASSLATYYEVTGETVSKIVPNVDLANSDFADIWWVGDYSDNNGETGAGFLAIKLMNSLSTSGFQLKSTDKAKGQFSFEFTGHYSINAQDTVPVEIYVQPGSAS